MSFETELHELLERSADRFDPDPAVLADAERRAARMVRARRWTRGLAAAAAAAAAAVAAGVVLTGGPDPAPPVIGPGPTPSPTGTPTVPEETETTGPQETETDGPGDQQATSVTVTDLGRTVAVAQPGDDGGTRIELHRPDGTTSTIQLPSADPSGAWWFVDAEGGVVWQASDAGSPAVVRTTPDGDTTLVEAVIDDTAERYQLVGLTDGGRVLVEHRRGGDPDDMTADLLAVPFDGSTPEVLAVEVGGWESGIIHAAADPESRLYSLSAEASQYAVLDRADGTRTTVFEAGEPTGEYLNGVAITDAGTGIVLVETAAGYPDLPRARVLVVDLTTSKVTDEIDVPLQSGIGDTWNVPRELSHAGDHVLVNRYAEGDWLTPLVLDLDARRWAVLDVTGRTRLGPSAQVPTLVEPECDDGGSCAAGFLIDDRFYALSCGAVRPDLVTHETVARGELYGQMVEVRSVEGASSDVLVAVSLEGGRCGDDDVVLSPWSMAFPDDASQSDIEAAICVVVVDEQKDVNDCG